MRISSTKTSNMSRKRHSVVEIHLSYRKSTLPERIAGSEAPIAVSGMRSENRPKTRLMCCQIATICPFIRNRGR